MLLVFKEQSDHLEKRVSPKKWGWSGPLARPPFPFRKNVFRVRPHYSVKRQKCHAFPNWSCRLDSNIYKERYEWWQMQHERGHRRIDLSRTTPSIPWIQFRYFGAFLASKKYNSGFLKLIYLQKIKSIVHWTYLANKFKSYFFHLVWLPKNLFIVSEVI